MNIQSYFDETFPKDIDFEAMKRELKQAPLYLEVRECDDLFTLMFSDESPKDHPAVNQCVGPVFDKKDKILRGYGLDRTEELVIDPRDPVWGSLDRVDLTTDRVIQYVEGIKLTVFHYSGKWRISTTRVIDAFKSFWSSSKSFGTMFMEACKMLHPQMHAQLKDGSKEGPLNEQQSYVFILSTPDHKFIKEVLKPALIHASTFCLNDKKYVTRDLGVPKQTTVTFPNLDVLKQKVNTLEPLHPGYIIEGSSRLRIITTEYKRIQGLRGNTPDPFRHYLDVRQGGVAYEELLYYYPEFRNIGDYVEAKINELACAIYELYLAFFIKRLERPHLDKTLFVTLMQLHSDYHRTGIKRTKTIVYQRVSSMPAALLYRLLTNTEHDPSSLPVVRGGP